MAGSVSGAVGGSSAFIGGAARLSNKREKPPLRQGKAVSVSRRARVIRSAAQTEQLVSLKPSSEARQALFGTMDEQREEVELEVEGEIPEWLCGSYLRNGGGSWAGLKHMFDGYAALQKIRVSGGKAFGMHRFIESEAWKSKRDTGKMRWREFATPIPHDGPVSILREVAESSIAMFGVKAGLTDNASVNIVPHPAGGKGRGLALTESILGAYEVDMQTLETVERADWDDSIPGMLTTAHPHVTVDGDIINFTSEIGRGGVHLYRLKAGTMERTEIAFIPHRDATAPAWMHDFALSENYAVLVEMPLFFNIVNLMTGGESDHLFMDWKPEKGTRIHVVELKTGKVITKSAPAFWAFHFVNAFENENGTEIYVDAAAFRTPKVLNQLSIDPLMNVDSDDLDPSHPARITVRLGEGSGNRILPKDMRRLQSNGSEYGDYFELPTMNHQYRCKSYRYSYGISAARPTNIANTLSKHDHEKGTSKMWVNGEGGTTGEPKFIPRPGATEEDDGVVVSICCGQDGNAFCVFLDGQSFLEIARAEMPYGLTYGFHGNWFPMQQ